MNKRPEGKSLLHSRTSRMSKNVEVDWSSAGRIKIQQKNEFHCHMNSRQFAIKVLIIQKHEPLHTSCKPKFYRRLQMSSCSQGMWKAYIEKKVRSINKSFKKRSAHCFSPHGSRRYRARRVEVRTPIASDPICEITTPYFPMSEMRALK